MPKNLAIADAEGLGMKFANSLMDNGEYRFRLMGADGSGYIRTVMPADRPGEWQNSHYHGGVLLDEHSAPPKKGVIEMIIVQTRWVVTADLLPGGKRQLGLYRRNEFWVSQPGIAHNIYMPRGSVTHCVKYGDDVVNPAKNSDWYPAPDDFDVWTKSLDEAAIFKQLGLSGKEIADLAA